MEADEPELPGLPPPPAPPPVAKLAPATAFVFPNSLTIAGTLHIIHNLRASMHTVFRGWDELWRRLKNFESLLCSRRRRDRLIATCVLGSAVNETEAARTLRLFSARLYEKRWRCVADFIAAVLKLWPILRRVWSPQKWSSNVDSNRGGAQAGEEGDAQEGDGDGDGLAQFDSDLLSDSLKSVFFFLQLHLVVCLQALCTAWRIGRRCVLATRLGSRGSV